MSALRVGLTGGLGSGKSTVARWLAEAGCEVVDADRLVAELYAPGEPGAAAVARLFGREYLDPAGAVDRPRLAARIFANPADRQDLEAAIHPLVRERFARQIAGIDGIAVLEATLLVEAGYGPDFDLVVSVEADRDLRLDRAVARGLDEREARARLAAQGSGDTRRAGAHLLLDNDGDLAALRSQVDELVINLRVRATARR